MCPCVHRDVVARVKNIQEKLRAVQYIDADHEMRCCLVIPFQKLQKPRRCLISLRICTDDRLNTKSRTTHGCGAIIEGDSEIIIRSVPDVSWYPTFVGGRADLRAVGIEACRVNRVRAWRVTALGDIRDFSGIYGSSQSGDPLLWERVDVGRGRWIG